MSFLIWHSRIGKILSPFIGSQEVDSNQDEKGGEEKSKRWDIGSISIPKRREI